MRHLNLINLHDVFRNVHNYLQSEALAKAVSFIFASWTYEIVPIPQQENGNIWFAIFFVFFFNHIISYYLNNVLC